MISHEELPIGAPFDGTYYPAPAFRAPLHRHTYLVFYAPSPWARYMLRRDWLGDHARWEIELARKYGPKWPRWRDLHPWAPWRPIVMPPAIAEVFVPWWAQLGGWLIALWACREALRG